MKNNKNPLFFSIYKFFVFIFIINFLILFITRQTEAYGKYVHSYLTQEILTFYNQHFLQNKISEELAPYLIEGSLAEDVSPRWFNHYYDPVFNRGLSYDARIDPLINVGTWQKSKYWAQDNNNQERLLYRVVRSIGFALTSIQQRQVHSLASETNFTWQRAIDFYLQGEEEKAMFVLGHILHLIQDKSVPDHTRNDPHPFDSPFELFADRYTINSPDRNLPKRLQNRQPIILNDLNSYFHNLAIYSNNNFYSKDTIGIQSGFNKPQPTYFSRLSDNRIYGMKECNEFGDFPLIMASRLAEIRSETELINQPLIMSAYWKRLSTKAVRYGAGVINLFFQEVEKQRRAPRVQIQQKENVGFVASAINALSGLFQRRGDFVVVENTAENISPIILQNQNVEHEPLLSLQNQEELRQPVIQECSFNTTLTPLRQVIIFNEIAWMGTTASANDEWIELRNITNQTIDISGWQIVDQEEQIKISFLSGSRIPAQGFYLLERGNDFVVSNIRADLIYTGSITNTNEGLRLFNNNCQLQDEAFARPNWLAGNNISKKTMERGTNLIWHTSNVIGGTPKRTNSIPAIVPVAPDLDSIVNQFNQTNQQNQTQNQLQNQTPNQNQILEQRQTQNQAPSQIQNQNNACSFATNQSIPQQTIIFSEIAWMGTTVSANDEWIELRNITNQTIDISGWQIVDQGEQIRIIFPNNSLLTPNNFYLLERTDDNTLPKILADLTYTGSLANTNEGLSLFNNNCQLQDEVLANPNWIAGDNSSKKTMERGDNLTWHTSNVVGGTPKSINTLPTISQNPENINPPINQPSADNLPPTENILVQNILISEVMYGLSNCARCEFVELYNPTNQSINLQYLIGDNRLRIINTAGNITNRTINWKQTVIPSKGFFLLVADEHNDLLSQADATFNAFLSGSSGVQLTRDNGNIIIDEVRWLENKFKAGESWERKAQQNNICVSPQSAGEFLGNSCDTNDHLNDFELRKNPQPQNSFSLFEPQVFSYSISNFDISFDSKTMELVFNWAPIESSENKKINYKLEKYSSPSQTIFQSAYVFEDEPEFKKRIEEIGKNYQFSLSAFDESGNQVAFYKQNYFVPSFLNSLNFYEDQQQPGKYFLSAYYNDYPFVPDLHNRPDTWRILVFYLNSEASEQRDEHLTIENSWQPIRKDNVLKITYPRCNTTNYNSYSLILPDRAERCYWWGSLNNDGKRFGLLEDNFFRVQVDNSLQNIDFSETDYLTVAYYSFYFSGFGQQTFSLVATDRTKFYFQNDAPEYFSPEPPTNVQFVLNKERSELTTSWDMAKDKDSVDSHLNYKISYNGGPWILTHLSHTKLVEQQKNYQIRIKTVDRAGLKSEIISLEYDVDEFVTPFGITNVRWGHLNNTSTVEISFEFDKYPFIPQGWSPWSAIIFYFNQMPPDLIGHPLSFSIGSSNEKIVNNNQQLILYYPQCSSSPTTAVALYLATKEQHCFHIHSLPLFTNQIILPNEGERGRITVEVKGITNNEKLINQFNSNDYFTMAFFNSYSRYFNRIGASTRKYFFNQ